MIKTERPNWKPTKTFETYVTPDTICPNYLGATTIDSCRGPKESHHHIFLYSKDFKKVT